MKMRIGWVQELYRYPVKSMQGEQLSATDVTERGLRYDRMWATRTPGGKLGSGKSTKRLQRIEGLSTARARCEAGIPVITLPDGTERRGDDPQLGDWLSSAFGQPVTLHRDSALQHFDDGPVHLVATTSLHSVQRATGVPVDRRRLRANVVLAEATPTEFPGAELPGAEFPEDEWLGCHLHLGDQVVLKVVGAMRRCVMVNHPVGELPRDDRVLKAITAAHHVTLGVFATVVRGGRMAVGDQVRLRPALSAPSPAATVAVPTVFQET